MASKDTITTVQGAQIVATGRCDDAELQPPGVPGRDILVVGFITGLLGLYFGLQSPVLHVAVETGQVLAGIVQYPADSPVYIYHLRIWSLANQFSAALLKLGFDVETVSLILSTIITVFYFQSWAFCTLALSQNRYLALLTPLWFLFLPVSADTTIYPVLILGYGSTFGMLAISYTALTFGVVGLGRWSTGLFMATLAPAIHPLVGCFCLASIMVGLAWTWPESRSILKGHWRAIIVGLGITFISLCWQLWVNRSTFSMQTTDQAQVWLDAFVKHSNYQP